LRRAPRLCRHQPGTIAITPIALPAANAASTTITIGACHCVPKKPLITALCWLFSANANSAKKTKARSSQMKTRMRHRF